MPTRSKPTSVWEAYVRSDVFAGDWTEDGYRRDELAYYVVVVNDRGVQYASRQNFLTTEMRRDVAERRAEAFLRKVVDALRAGADPTKSPKWTRIQGAYGSPAWSEREELENEARALEVEAGVEEADRFRRNAGIGRAGGVRARTAVSRRR